MAKKRSKNKDDTIIFDVENEQIILSQMMKDTATRKRCSRELLDKYFIGKRHKVIFKTLCLMVSRGLEYNKDTFKTLAGSEEFGGFKYLNDVEKLFEENKNIDFHIERLKVDWKKLMLKQHEVKKLNDAIEDPSVDAKDLCKIIKSVDNSIKEIITTSNIKKGEELKKEYFESLKERQEVGKFIGTGFSFDEYLTEGLARRNISVIAARPSMGKTTIASIIADYLRSAKFKTLVLPLESGTDKFIDMIVSRRTGIDLYDLVRNISKLSKKQKIAISKEASRVIDDEYLHFCDDTSVTVNDLAIMLDNGNYAVCIIDLFEKLRDINFEPKIFAEKLKSIQKIAKETNTHICLLAQIKRLDLRKGGDLRPTLEDLKNSGAFEEVADLILFLHREFYYKPELNIDALEIIIAKQRFGVRNKTFYYEFMPSKASVGKELKDFIPLGDEF